MKPSDSSPHIFEIGTVFVPVTDQDRSLDFFLHRLGFEKRVDFIYGGGRRWLEVAPPGAHNTLSLVPPSEGRATGSAQTYCALATKDIDAEHARLKAQGVDVDPAIAREGSRRVGLTATDATIPDPVPAQFFLRDPDGNRFLVVQP